MPGCAVKGCKNYSTKVNKKDAISYHRFPTNPVRNEHWCRLIRLQRGEPYFKANKDTRICSAHFLEKDVDISKSGKRRLKGTATPNLTESERIKTRPKIPNDEVRPATPNVDNNSAIEVDISDLDSIFDSPITVHLKKKIDRLQRQRAALAKQNKILKMQNARLRKKNLSLTETVNELTQKKEDIPAAIAPAFEINIEGAIVPKE